VSSAYKHFASAVLCLAVFLLPAAAQVPLAQHVILIVNENTSYSTVVGPPPGAPWMVGEGNTYGHAGNYYSNTSGSLLDYLWLASGSSEAAFGCNGNDCTSPITDDNIFRLMSEQSISWKLYAQSYLNAGGTVTTPDSARGTHYYRRHNGAVWYSDILSNVLGAQGSVVDFEQFLVDVAAGTLPRFSIILPDGNYDAHDASIGQADAFLQNNLATLLTQTDFKSGGTGLILMTFDNGNGDAQGQVYTALMGPNVKGGTSSYIYYQHQNSLRTLLDSLGITTYPGGASGAADMSDFFKSTAGSVVINSPANQSIQGTTVPVNAAASELSSKIDHVEVWDNGIKLANVSSPNVNQNFILKSGSHKMTVQDIGPPPSYPILHTQTVSFTVSSTNGVFITTPATNSTQASLFPVNAYAVESGGNVDHMEVWADGSKLGDSPKGASISQWFNSLSAGTHQLTVEDVAASGSVLHSSTIPVTISSANNLYVNSPVKGTHNGTSVLVNAYSYEQTNSSQLVDHMEVWDSGTKLGNSPVGYGVTSLFINQNYTLSKGSHTLTVQDVGPAPNYSVLHKSVISLTVQ
jgi:acid phosphatase